MNINSPQVACLSFILVEYELVSVCRVRLKPARVELRRGRGGMGLCGAQEMPCLIARPHEDPGQTLRAHHEVCHKKITKSSEHLLRGARYAHKRQEVKEQHRTNG